MSEPRSPYAPPTAPTDLPGAVVSIPGVSARIEIQKPGRLLVNGQPAVKKFLGKYLIPSDDGRTLEARYVQGLTGAALVVDGKKYPVGPSYPAALGVLAFLPLGLLAVGGAVGGLLGGGAMVLNRSIAASERSTTLKVVLMLGTTLVATAIALAVATLLQTAFQR